MALVISTTGTTVEVTELGIRLVHPTTNFVISDKFDSEDIKRAKSLTTFIQAGTLAWKKSTAGATELPASYDPDFAELEEEYVGGQSSFGSYKQDVESPGQTTNNSTTTWVTKLTMTTPDLPLGDYLILVDWRWATSAANRGASFRLMDGATVLQLDEPFSATNTDRPYKLLKYTMRNVSGVKTLTVSFKAGTTANNTASTITMSEAGITIWRVK